MFPPATEQQFQQWERLIDEGVPPFQASRDVGTTLAALGKGDRVRKEMGMELAQERQAAAIEEQIEARVPESDQVLLAKAKAIHPAYVDKRQLEVSGTVEHEHHGRFNVAALFAIAAERGIGDNGSRSLPRVPAAGEVLPGEAE